LWIFAVNRADSRILKTQWIVDQLWILARILDCACLDVRILGSKQNLDHRYFFSLGWYVNEFIQIISFFERSSFKLRCETLTGIVLRYSHQPCCLLYYLCEINSGIHIYQSTFELLHFCFWMWLWFRIWTTILADRWIWQKKGTDLQICIPLFIPPLVW